MALTSAPITASLVLSVQKVIVCIESLQAASMWHKLKMASDTVKHPLRPKTSLVGKASSLPSFETV